MKIQIPKGALQILDILNLNKYEGYIVGGCVRDSIIDRNPNDWDLCTNCEPDKIVEIFNAYKVIPTGLKHGTVTIVVDHEQFEVTTYRIDKEYIDGRHPKEVEFTNSLKEDLKRRDFTINAMAYNCKDGLIDYYDGMTDILNEKIRSVGNPIERFSEDYLRMIRAIRFSTQLEYNIEVETSKAIKKLSENITNISSERIREEINKILLSEKPSRGFKLLNETGLLKYILPELQACIQFDQKNPFHDKDVFEHIMSVLDHTEKDLVLRIAALLHDIGKPKCFTLDENHIGHFYNHHMIGMDITEDILKRLKYDNKTAEGVKILVKEHMCTYDKVTPKAVKRLINRVGLDYIERLFKLQIADIKGSKEPHDFSSVKRVKELCRKVINEKQPISVKDLDINGYDLIQLGITRGKEMGVLLNDLLEKVLDNPALNEKELLINEVKMNK
ncbi:CCA tRNA nucleotidyltransferase [Lutibacter sp. B2]|nr:CCA tRNA nucleotidyltransferase [Lutibacter sp. B2]